MYALCASGAVNKQGFVWMFLFAIYKCSFIHPFIRSYLSGDNSALNKAKQASKLKTGAEAFTFFFFSLSHNQSDNT